MPINKVMIKLILCLFLIGTLNYLVSAQVCAPLGATCDQTCDCCNYETDPGVRCEKRNKDTETHCYTRKFCGDPCTDKSDCYSQNCGFPTTLFRGRKLQGGMVCLCGATDTQKCKCPITLIRAALGDDPPYDSSSRHNPMHVIDRDVDTYVEHDKAKKAALILTPNDMTEYNHVCRIRIRKYDDKEPKKIFLEGWCDTKHTWIDIPLKDNDLDFGAGPEVTKAIINPRSNGPYESFRVLFGDGNEDIRVSEIKLLYRCD